MQQGKNAGKANLLAARNSNKAALLTIRNASKLALLQVSKNGQKSALLTIQSGINQLRYATLKGIMAAKKKEIRKAALPADLRPSQQIVSLAVPARTKKTHLINGSAGEAAKELARLLRDEARVL